MGWGCDCEQLNAIQGRVKAIGSHIHQRNCLRTEFGSIFPKGNVLSVSADGGFKVVEVIVLDASAVGRVRGTHVG